MGVEGGRCTSSFIKQENWSAGFHTQAQIPFPQTYMKNMPAGHKRRDLSTRWPFLPSFPPCIKVGPRYCGCKTVTHFYAVENKMTFMRTHLTWKALMISSLGMVAVAKWLFYVWLSHLSLLTDPKDCVFLLCNLLVQRGRPMEGGSKKNLFFLSIYSHEILYSRYKSALQNANSKQLIPVWVLNSCFP